MSVKSNGKHRWHRRPNDFEEMLKWQEMDEKEENAKAAREGLESLLGKYRPAQGGHAPGHLRDAFELAVGEFITWKPGDPEPSVLVGDYEVPVPISQVFGWLWNCTDIMPGSLSDEICGMSDLPIRERCVIRLEARALCEGDGWAGRMSGSLGYLFV